MAENYNSIQEAWEFVKQQLHEEFPEEDYGKWFENLTVISETNHHITFCAPTDFDAFWIGDNYKDIIENKLHMAVGRSISVSICSVDNNEIAMLKPKKRSKSDKKTTTEENLQSDVTIMDGYVLNPKNTFDNFVVGPGNQMAHAACIAISNNPGKAYNPLFLYGYTGLGKTHLMHAVAHQIVKKNKKARVVYTSTEKFMNEFIQAVQFNAMPKFRQQYRNIDVLLLDDVQFLSGKERIQEEFFHTFNELFEAQKQIFLSSDRPADEISKLETRLISRFQWGLVIDVQPPDLETRIAILSRKAKDLNANIDQEIVNFLAEHVSTNIRSLEGALTRVVSYAKLTNQDVDINVAKMVMRDVFKEEAHEQSTSIDMIQTKVAEFFQLKLTDLLGKKRPANIAMPRQIAMYLCRCLTKQSLVEIGLAFGGRDHGTVIHACKSVENMIAQDDNIRKNVEYLKKILHK